MTVLEQPSEICHWPVNDSLVMDIKLMAMCDWPWSMTCGHKWVFKKCHWPRSMTEKSVIDWMYTIHLKVWLAWYFSLMYSNASLVWCEVIETSCIVMRIHSMQTSALQFVCLGIQDLNVWSKKLLVDFWCTNCLKEVLLLVEWSPVLTWGRVGIFLL